MIVACGLIHGANVFLSTCAWSPLFKCSRCKEIGFSSFIVSPITIPNAACFKASYPVFYLPQSDLLIEETQINHVIFSILTDRLTHGRPILLQQPKLMQLQMRLLPLPLPTTHRRRVRLPINQKGWTRKARDACEDVVEWPCTEALLIRSRTHTQMLLLRWVCMVGHIFAAEVGVYFFNYYYLLRWVCMVGHFFCAAEVGLHG